MHQFYVDVPPMPRGVAQIEVTFNIDAIDTFIVEVCEKSTGAKMVSSCCSATRLQREIERLAYIDVASADAVLAVHMGPVLAEAVHIEPVPAEAGAATPSAS